MATVADVGGNANDEGPLCTTEISVHHENTKRKHIIPDSMWIWILHSIMFLFLIESFSYFVGYIYGVCLLGLSISPIVLSILCFAFPIFLVVLRSRPVHKHIVFGIGVMALLCRVALSLCAAGGGSESVVVSGALASGFSLLFYAAWFTCPTVARANNCVDIPDDASLSMGIGLCCAVAASVLSRSIGYSLDILMLPWWQCLSWALAIKGTGIMRVVLKVEADVVDSGGAEGDDSATVSLELLASHPKVAASLRVPRSNAAALRAFLTYTMYAVGWFGVIGQIFVCFANPLVFCRWAEAPPQLVLSFELVSLLAFGTTLARYPEALTGMNNLLLLAWNVLFSVSFVATSALTSAEASTVQHVFLSITLLLWPVIILDFVILSRKMYNEQSTWCVSSAFTVGAMCTIVLIFSIIFTITWPYTSSEFMRDRFWMCVAGMTLATLVPSIIASGVGVRRFRMKPLEWDVESPKKSLTLLMLLVLALTCVGALSLTYATEARPASRDVSSAFVAVTYNVQQGYDLHGALAYSKVYDTLQSYSPTIVALQESDTARISSLNGDIVYYLASRLNMHSYYGPKTIAGTYGIALLSAYPITKARTVFLPSVGEQVAAISADILLPDGREFNVFVTHLGDTSQPKDVQNQANMMVEMMRAAGPNVVMMCDCNMLPDSPPYKTFQNKFYDGWLEVHKDGKDANGYGGYTCRDEDGQLTERLDYVWVSDNINVERIEVGRKAKGSDHLPVRAILSTKQATPKDI